MAAFGPLSFLYPFDDFTFAYPYIFVLLLGWGCLKTFFLRFETAPLLNDLAVNKQTPERINLSGVLLLPKPDRDSEPADIAIWV